MTEAIADYVFEDGDKPHELRQAQNVQRWGDPYGKGFVHWPFGMLDKCNAALNLYEVCKSWQATPNEKQGEWMQANPKAWEHIISPLMKRGLDNGKAEAWL